MNNFINAFLYSLNQMLGLVGLVLPPLVFTFAFVIGLFLFIDVLYGLYMKMEKRKEK